MKSRRAEVKDPERVDGNFAHVERKEGRRDGQGEEKERHEEYLRRGHLDASPRHVLRHLTQSTRDLLLRWGRSKARYFLPWKKRPCFSQKRLLTQVPRFFTVAKATEQPQRPTPASPRTNRLLIFLRPSGIKCTI